MSKIYHLLDIPDDKLTETHKLFVLYVMRDYLGHHIDIDEFTFFELEQSFGAAKTKFASVYGAKDSLLEFWIVYHGDSPSGLAFRLTNSDKQDTGMVQFNIVAIHESGVRKLIEGLPSLSKIVRGSIH
ncbi:hypothetical protein [Vibrio parahaemolyticus]|uniref:hypothetical protein n=1 Tax=Vibrio parahaemolyticus TaxID=670 RepID=UPI00226BB15A|nr:hypothetical protein [Vibrio parahaemolyticus]MCX8941263.1 hypothetical protein [Vibrio parahaemolyticus]